jgi:hypothetical protein
MEVAKNTLDSVDLGPPDKLSQDFTEKLDRFMSRFLGIAVPAGLDDLIAETESSDVKLKTVVQEFAARKDLCDIFVPMVSATRNREEAIPLEECIRIFGIQNSAVSLIAYKIADHLQCKALARDPKTGRLLAPPHQILRFAFKARQAVGEDSRYSDSAFSAGLVFDLLALVIATDCGPTEIKRLTDFLEARFTRGLSTAMVAMRLARVKTHLALAKHIVSAPLLREAAKAAMAMIHPEYPDFVKAVDRSHAPLAARNLAEQAKFGGNYQSISQVLSWTFEILSGSGEALIYIDSPYLLLESRKNNEFDLAAICYLAAYLDVERPALRGETRASEVCPELQGLDLSFNPASVLKKEGA